MAISCLNFTLVIAVKTNNEHPFQSQEFRVIATQSGFRGPKQMVRLSASWGQQRNISVQLQWWVGTGKRIYPIFSNSTEPHPTVQLRFFLLIWSPHGLRKMNIGIASIFHAKLSVHFWITANDAFSKDNMKTNADQRHHNQTLTFLPDSTTVYLLNNRGTVGFPCPSIQCHTESPKERAVWWLQSATTTKSLEILHSLNMCSGKPSHWKIQLCQLMTDEHYWEIFTEGIQPSQPHPFKKTQQSNKTSHRQHHSPQKQSGEIHSDMQNSIIMC